MALEAVTNYGINSTPLLLAAYLLLFFNSLLLYFLILSLFEELCGVKKSPQTDRQEECFSDFLVFPNKAKIRE